MTPDNTYIVGKRKDRPGSSRICRTCTLEKTAVRNKQRSAAKQADRTDTCAREGCEVSMAGRHLNAKCCSEECSYAVILEKNRQRRYEARAVRA